VSSDGDVPRFFLENAFSIFRVKIDVAHSTEIFIHFYQCTCYDTTDNSILHTWLTILKLFVSSKT
jgi:hypothetical protein